MAHDEDIWRGDGGVVGERDQRHIGGSRLGQHGADIAPHQGTEDQLVAIRDRPARGVPGISRSIVSGDAQIAGIGVEQRHGRGVGDRLADRAIVTRHRHQQRNPVMGTVLGQRGFAGDCGWRRIRNRTADRLAAFGNDRTGTQQNGQAGNREVPASDCKALHPCRVPHCWFMGSP